MARRITTGLGFRDITVFNKNLKSNELAHKQQEALAYFWSTLKACEVTGPDLPGHFSDPIRR